MMLYAFDYLAHMLVMRVHQPVMLTLWSNSSRPLRSWNIRIIDMIEAIEKIFDHFRQLVFQLWATPPFLHFRKRWLQMAI